MKISKNKLNNNYSFAAIIIRIENFAYFWSSSKMAINMHIYIIAKL